MGAKIKEVEERVYLLYYEGKPLHVVQSSNRYSAPRLSKRVYFTERDAKIGIKNLPGGIDREKVEIVAYVPEVKRND
jgi:hypothetical protein